MSRYPRRLILTFDAFGTLFIPRETIGKSYANAARSHGLSGFTDDQIATDFRNAFKEEQSKAPNYGKHVGMGAPRWWSNVIHTTFKPYSEFSSLPHDLVRDLLHRFGSLDGYMLYPDVVPAFEELRHLRDVENRNATSPKLLVGVITNSDDRVPCVLSSLGLKINPRRYGTLAPSLSPFVDREDDVDFIVTSYDVGYEKPSREIFEAARQVVCSEWGPETQGDRFVHIGDDMDKDFRGAELAGWESVLLDREGRHGRCGTQGPQAAPRISTLRELRSYIMPDS